MEFLTSVVGFFLHIDTQLEAVIAQYGTLTYALLFIVFFCETGLVVTPFLPGDSLLFAAGAFAARGSLNLPALLVLLSIAAIVGDSVNYAVGALFGKKVFEKNYRFLNQSHLRKAEEFYERHGGKAIVLGRFAPIIRTFVPFVAGVGRMNYGKFLMFNVIGGIVWIVLFLCGGYFFGALPFVAKHFEIVILAIIGVSLLPIVWEYLKAKYKLNR